LYNVYAPSGLNNFLSSLMSGSSNIGNTADKGMKEICGSELEFLGHPYI